ncbi:DUF5677 domain-containing protein [Streptacidiphilus rugosus]|uniref:DUF5677 domain-containing protein n=1 Tax=Streptacidiphilus rugosus TaxID=405783 RepID=UPI000562F7FB|nr:DUF5677 domain-containing protein [Streptacidiphilus rugosus]
MASVSRQQYRAAVEKMLANYRDAEPIETKQRLYRPVLIAHGWCAEVHRLAEAALKLLDLGYGHEATILLRTMFETTISLHWLYQKGEAGAEGVVTEGARQNRAAAEDMETAFAPPPDVIDAIKKTPVIQTEESRTFSKVMKQCDAIDPTKALYSIYRYLCRFAHPTAASADAFIEESMNPPHVRPTPKDRESMVEVTSAMCLLWAGRAFDEMLNGKPRKRFLRAVAKEVQLAPILPYIH